MPFYLHEEDMAKDEAARGRLNWLSGDQRQRAAAEAEWRANRRIESEKPGEGDTFLPEG
jgi:predicted 2-oxoglutarate/Fe(II)-dependent dioxygenase YbiX